MATKLMTQKELAEYLGCHRNTIPRMEKLGSIPKPMLNATRQRQWLREEVERWFAQPRTTSHNDGPSLSQ